MKALVLAVLLAGCACRCPRPACVPRSDTPAAPPPVPAPRAERSVEDLLRALRETPRDPEVRKALAAAPDAERSVAPALATLLRPTTRTREDWAVVRAAADLARRMGPRARAAVPALVALVAEEGVDPLNLERRRQGDWSAQAALVAVGRDAVVPVSGLLRHERSWVRAHAIRILGQIGPPSLEVDGLLAEAVEKEDGYDRRRAIEAVREIGALTPALRAALTRVRNGDPDEERRALADEALRLPAAPR